jgi:hypothetical protein
MAETRITAVDFGRMLGDLGTPREHHLHLRAIWPNICSHSLAR